MSLSINTAQPLKLVSSGIRKRVNVNSVLASLSIGLIQARKLLEGYWKDGLDNAERDLENGYDTAENEFSIEIDEYSIQFKVKVEKTGQHINQAKWDKVSEFRESVFSEEEE